MVFRNRVWPLLGAPSAPAAVTKYGTLSHVHKIRGEYYPHLTKEELDLDELTSLRSHTPLAMLPVFHGFQNSGWSMRSNGPAEQV